MSNQEIWAVGRILATTTTFLGAKGSLTPRLDAELLLARILKMSKVQLYLNFEREMSLEELGEYRELIRRRSRLEPVAYILGEREFYGLKLKITPAVFIPRPETEHLVDEVLRLSKTLWPNQSLRLADIGCGSGAIALALAQNIPTANLEAVDISVEALALAEENASALSLADRVNFYSGDLLAPLADSKFHLICANLPYIPTSNLDTLMPDVVQYEPRLALDGGPEGLTVINRLIQSVSAYLEPGGRLLMEIWPPSLASLEKQASAIGFSPAEVIQDLAGRQHFVVLTANKS